MKRDVQFIKDFYKPGSRIWCREMEGEPSMSDVKGTVAFVDDFGDIHVDWDNGRGLALIPGVDKYGLIMEDVKQ